MDIESLGYIITENGEIINPKGKRLSGWDNQGYRMITISKRKLSIHRLVATKFIPNPDNLSCVNHKDGNRSNNRIENLEWVTPQRNVEHGIAKNYIVENVTTKEIFNVFNLNQWCKERNMYSGALIGTFTGTNRKQHKGFRVLKIE